MTKVMVSFYFLDEMTRRPEDYIYQGTAFFCAFQDQHSHVKILVLRHFALSNWHKRATEMQKKSEDLTRNGVSESSTY